MKKIAIAVISLLVTACGIVDKIRGKDDELKPLEPNPVPAITQEVTLQRAWSFNVGGGKQVGLRPAMGANAVFIANPGGGVAAVDFESGSVEWRTRLDMTITGGVGTGEGLVMVGGLDGEVVALDIREGYVVWRRSVRSEVMAPPKAEAGIVVVRTIDGGVTGLSTTSGEIRWNLRHDVPSLTLRGSSPPLIDRGVAVMGFADGKLAAINIASGAIVWEVSVSRPSGTNELERMIDVDAAPVLRGNVLYAVSFQGNITAYALGANQVMWSRKISSHTDFAIDADSLYVSDSTGRVHALNRSNGRELWVEERLLRRRLSGSAVVGDYVVVGDYEGYLHIMDKSDGRLVGRGKMGDRIATQPLVRNNRIVVMTEDGTLQAVSITDVGG